MLKNKILLAIFALVLSTTIKSQTIVIDDARLLGALPVGGSYGSGSTVAIPISVNGCTNYASTYQWNVLSPAGLSVGANGSVTAFYTTFINITLPNSLATGNYKVEVKSTTAGSVNDTSALFPVTNIASPIIAKATPVFSDLILAEQFYYGICDGNSISGMSLKDSSTAGGVDTLELIDNYRLPAPAPVKYLPNASGEFDLVFNTTLVGAKFRDAYYTAYVKTIGAGNIVSTKGYHIVNNSWDIQANVLAKAPGTSSSCAGDTVNVQIVIDRTQNQHLQQNFPGATIRVNWNDIGNPNNIETYSQCQILALNGKLKHRYSNGACLSAGSTTYKITATVNNPFTVFNGPGITGTCAAGAKSEAEAFVFSPPKADFSTDSVICAMDTLVFKNKSKPGQGLASNAGLFVCSNLANYTWVIDGNTVAPLYKTPSGKVELPKDTAYSFNANQEGYHNVTLYINNNYGLQAPCPAHDTTKRVCVDTARVRPNFKLDSAGVLKDSLLGCAPVFCIKNNTRSTFCVDSTKFKYHWRVLDATSPGPNYTEVPKSSGAFSYATGSSDTSRQPCMSINKTGKYFIELMASASCALDSSLRMMKYIEANGDAGVNFPLGSDTVYFCGSPTPLTIDYSPTAPFNNQIGLVDSVHYTYQASSAGALSFFWSVKRTPAAVSPTDYEFIGGTTSTSQYPQIRFNTPGLYAVKDSFSNNCQPKTAIQYVAYRQPVTANSGGTIDSICHTTNTFNITGASVTGGGTVGQIVWGCTNCDGTFSPASGTPATPNIFNPVYTPGPNDKLISCDTGFTFNLSMTSYGIRPSNCSILSSTRRLFIRPCVTVPDAELDGCSGSAVNYSITKPGLSGSIFTWTSVVPPNGGVVNNHTQNTVTGSTTITDVLTGDGYVIYTLYPSKDGCVGNPFTVSDTVRPQPTAPTVNLNYPSNTPPSMCSGDTVNIQMTGNSPNDLFNWTAYNNQGRITGFSTGTNQAGQILDQLFNNTAPLLIDTATYCIKTVSKYGCVGPQTCQSIIVTPGPNKALVTEPTKLRYLCRLGCDTLKANGPGAAGAGTWTIKSYTGASVPVIGNPNDSITTVCGLLPNQSYYFQWEIAPVVAGCFASTDVLNIQVSDTIPTPSAGTDTVICDVNGATQRVVFVNGTLSRPLLGSEYVYYNGVMSSNLTYPFYFTNKGLYTIEMRVKNFVCPDKVDTMLVRAFTQPLGGSVTVSPIQTSFCQGSPVTLTANFDTSVGDIYKWEYQIARPPYTTFQIGQGQNPYTYTADENSGYNGLIISKGWNYGCRGANDSVYTSGLNIKVDSTTIVGAITGTDTIVCVPNTVVTLKVNGNRGSVKGWIRSTISATTGYSAIFALGNPVSVSVGSTTWYRAIVQNGNCATDTTAPFRIFIPSGADAAKTGNDTAVCNATSFLLQGNVPLVGNGSWEMIQGLINTPLAGTFTFGAAPNDTTSQNPVLANIQQFGTYKFVWKIKNLTCDATADTITIINTAPIGSNSIGTAADTVCNGTKVTVTSGVPTGGSGIFTYNWQSSTDNGATWTTNSLATFSYSFTATTDVWVRRVVKSDSCYDYGNIIKFVVQPNITNNTITPAFPAICYNNPAPAITGSTPAGGSGTFAYTWNYGTNTDTANHLWINPNVATQSYTPAFNLIDTLHVRRIVTSGKCSDTSAIATITLLPDAKANYTSSAPNANTRCAPYNIGGDITNIVLPNTSYAWYITTSAGVRTLINTGNQFSGYTITNGLDNVKLTLIATSTTIPACKTDSMSMVFNTSATPKASFTISAPLGCASNTNTNATNFVFTNTTPNKALFTSVNWNLNSSTVINSGSIDLPSGGFQFNPSSSGLDTVYNITLTVNSPSCGTSQFVDTVRVRTKPSVRFSASPSYVCSGNPVSFTNVTVGNNLTYKWIFGDAGQATGSTNVDTVSHAYTVNSLTTICPKLVATNECASDSTTNCISVEANKVLLNISVKGTDKYKCLPDTVTFYTNSNGANTYTWDFGDGSGYNPTTGGIDSITYIYTTPGKFTVKLTGTTFCGGISKTDTVYAYGNPIVTYNISPNTTVCIGDTVKFTNVFNDSTTYNWNFGNGFGGGANPTRTYASIGTFPIQFTGKRQYTTPLGGPIFCTATSGIQTVTIRDTMKASFVESQIGTTCVPYVSLFTDNTVIPTQPLISTTWSFGDGSPSIAANGTTTHTYTALNTYTAKVVIKNAGGCTYIDSTPINVNGPIGTWTHDTGYICGSKDVKFYINANLTDSVRINFGLGLDTTILYATMPNPLLHSYASGGTYTPLITLIAANGCTYDKIPVYGTVRVDYVKAAYTINTTPNCGNTVVNFIDNSFVYQSPANAVYDWRIDGVAIATKSPSITYTSTADHTIKLLVTSVSGCFDSVATDTRNIQVNNIPIISRIVRQDTVCAGQIIYYTADVAPSQDPILTYTWKFANGTTGTGQNTSTVYGTANNNYFDTLTVATASCPSTLISNRLVVNPTPTVSISPSNDTIICAGSPLTLTASGATRYKWTPNAYLSPNDSAAIISVSPDVLTKYVLTGTNIYGCVSNAPSITVNTISNFTPSIFASPNDTLCLGDSILLRVVGAPVGSTFKWTPNNSGLSSQTGISVFAKPTFTTQYKVEITDPAGCFPKEDSVWVGVGDTLNINLGLDTVYLQGGTKLQLNAGISGSQSIANWNWTPSAGLSCTNCGNPEATIGSNICYSVEATSIYGCKASDDICIVAFCEASQVYIPNAFTPDGDGINDYFYVSATGITKVLSFRVFNRWGQVVFERSGFTPVPYKSTLPNTLTSWNGFFKGVIAPTDVYVYTCEVVCANGTKFTYTGNVTLIK